MTTVYNIVTIIHICREKVHHCIWCQKSGNCTASWAKGTLCQGARTEKERACAPPQALSTQAVASHQGGTLWQWLQTQLQGRGAVPTLANLYPHLYNGK